MKQALVIAAVVLALAPGCRDSARVAQLENEIALRIAERERVADLAERLEHSRAWAAELTERLDQVQATSGRGTPPEEGLAHIAEHRKGLLFVDRKALGVRIEGRGAPPASARALEELARTAPALPVKRVDLGEKGWSIDVPREDPLPAVEAKLPAFRPDPASAIAFPRRDLAPRSVRYLEAERATLDGEIAALQRDAAETERLYARARELEAKLALLDRPDRLRHVADAVTRLFGERGAPLVTGSVTPEGPVILFIGVPRKKDPDVRRALGAGWNLAAIAGAGDPMIGGTITLEREEK